MNHVQGPLFARIGSAFATSLLVMQAITSPAAGQDLSVDLLPQGDQSGAAPSWLCFDALNPPPPAQLAILEKLNYQADLLAGATSSSSFSAGFFNWSDQGEPASITWSLAQDGVSIPGGGDNGPTEDNSLFATMNAKFGGNQQLWIDNIQSTFDRWEELTGLTFTRVSVPGQEWDNGAAWGTAGNDINLGDIRVSSRTIDGGGGILAFASFPTNGDMVLDKSENWTSGSTDRFMRNIVAHELGHSLGLGHSCPVTQSKLMEPFISTAFDGPQHDDVRGMHRLYGDEFEFNNGGASAAALGPMPPGEYTFGEVPGSSISNTRILSIDDSEEKDWYRFTVSEPTLLTVEVTPFGFEYEATGQNGQTGQCSTGNFVESNKASDMSLQVRSSPTSIILGSADRNGLGKSEVLPNVLLPGQGHYYIRIAESNTPELVQLYELQTITESCSVLAQDCNQNGIEDDCEIVSFSSPDFDLSGVLDSCEPFSADIDTISLAAGGTANFTLDAGSAFGDMTYWLFGSVTGNSPGLDLGGGVLLPLNYDAYFLRTVQKPNQSPLSSSLGTLDAGGEASASFSLPPGADPSLAGIEFSHAFAALDAQLVAAFASNAMPTRLIP